nr:hypothetical protein [uncultured Rhodoferax sp.]
MENIKSPDVAALQALCDKEGGYKVVAKAIGVNDQSIYQIVSGVLLPSGRPKGVGPGLKDKLNARYPDWSGPRKEYASQFPSKPSDMAIKLAAAFDRIPPDPVKQARAFAEAFAAIEKSLST